MIRLKHLCSRWGEYGLGIPAEYYASEGVRLIRTSDITDDGKLTPAEEGVFINPGAVNGMDLQTGDLLISRSGTVGRSLLFNKEEHGRCTFAAYLVRFRLRDGFDSRFVYYFTKSLPFEQQIRLDETQATIANFNAQKLGNLEVRAFSEGHQRAIGDFLDRETARLDALIERKQALVGLLHDALTARIAARIGEAARISLNLRLRCVAAVSFSNVDKKANEGDQSVRLCNYTDVYERDEIGDDPGFMEATATSNQIKRLGLRRGDVLVTKDSETPDDIGVPAWVPGDLTGVVCGYHLAIIRPDQSRLRGDYLFWALRSPRCQSQFSMAANGITRFGLRADAVKDIQLPVPSLGEQAAISAELTSAASAALEAADALSRQVSLLREHRQALITAAVTGQLEVSAGNAA